MEQWFIVDAEGNFVDVILSDTVFQLDEGFRIVKKAWPDGMYKPRHNEETDEWESGETEEEREKRKNAPVPVPPEQRAAKHSARLLLELAKRDITIKDMKRQAATTALILAKNKIS